MKKIISLLISLLIILPAFSQYYNAFIIGSYTSCYEEAITVSAADGYAKYKWCTGEETQSITISEEGYYWVTVENAAGTQYYDSTWASEIVHVTNPKVYDTISIHDEYIVELDTFPDYLSVMPQGGAYFETVGEITYLRPTAYDITEGFVNVLLNVDFTTCHRGDFGEIKLTFSDPKLICDNGNRNPEKILVNDVDLPVCGCDGVEYRNIGEANVAGIGYYSIGACGEAMSIPMDTVFCQGQVDLPPSYYISNARLLLNGVRTERRDLDTLPAGKYDIHYTYSDAGFSYGYAYEGTITIEEQEETPPLEFDTVTGLVTTKGEDLSCLWFETAERKWYHGIDTVFDMYSWPETCEIFAELESTDGNACGGTLTGINLCDTVKPFDPFPEDTLYAPDGASLFAGLGYMSYYWNVGWYEPYVELQGEGWVKVTAGDSDLNYYSDSVYLLANKITSVDIEIVMNYPIGVFIKLYHDDYVSSSVYGSGVLGYYQGEFGYFASPEDYTAGNVVIELECESGVVWLENIVRRYTVNFVDPAAEDNCLNPDFIDVDALGIEYDSIGVFCGCNGVEYYNAEQATDVFGVAYLYPGECLLTAETDLIAEDTVCLDGQSVNVVAQPGYEYYFWDTEYYSADDASASSALLGEGMHSLIALDEYNRRFADTVVVEKKQSGKMHVFIDTIAEGELVELTDFHTSDYSILPSYEGELGSYNDYYTYQASQSEIDFGMVELTAVAREDLPFCQSPAMSSISLYVKKESDTLAHLSVNVLVQEPTNQPANDGAAWVEIAGGTEPYDIKWSCGSTNERIEHLSSGDYSVTVQDAAGDVFDTTFRLNSATELKVYSLSGTVTAGDKPAEGAKLFAFKLDGSCVNVSFSADVAEGEFTLPNVIEGEYVLLAVKPGSKYAPTYYSNRSLAKDAYKLNVYSDIIDLDIALSTTDKQETGTASVAGQVTLAEIYGPDSVFSTGNSLAQIYPVVLLMNGEVVAVTVTDTKGSYIFDNIPSGEYTVSLNKPGVTGHYSSNVTVENGKDYIAVDFTAETQTGTTKMQSTVLQVYPNPAKRWVTLSNLQGESVSLHSADGTVYGLQRSGERYLLPDVPAGVYFLHVTNESGECAALKIIVE